MDYEKIATAGLESGAATGAGALVGGVLGKSDGAIKRRAREQYWRQVDLGKRSYKRTRNAMKLGNQLDMQNQKEMYDYRIQSGLDAGMTPYEMYVGSSAGGAGGGTTGSGATLGNAASQQGMQAAEAQNQLYMQRQQQEYDRESRTADRMTQLMMTKMQTDTQKDVANINAGTQQRGQDIQKEIADNVLSLNQRELEDVKIPQAAAAVNLSKQQLQTEINKTATSSAKFQTAMKQLSMGPANLLVELTLRDEGISLNDDSFQKLSDKDRKRILDKLVALSSSVYIETSGVTSAIEKPINTAGDWLVDLIVEFMTKRKGIESTNAPANTPNLGNSMSEPIGYGPDMETR